MEFYPEKFGAILILSQIAASLVADHLSMENLQSLRKRMSSLQWEQDGEIYQHYFRIRIWKDKVPEMGNQFNKAHLAAISEAYLEQFILESERAELCHGLALVFALPILLNADPSVTNWAILYCLVANVPFILIQRYNRPRFEKILKTRKKTEEACTIQTIPALSRR
ncbi:hypothetical protein [uncultured Sphaerochaeta sp.]|uniref:glycosyl-4,4'-diaponeurosporenoate acyltransferase CrtO family protein n=1 Tax=uncultured Sphaerochaeta sp. TaxID=886478 RepID=UPI002A0A6DC7|nr:hypothetical protein [uncultured Sphaerochaeta sp.]